MQRDKMADALLGAAIKLVEELEALVIVVGNVTTEPNQVSLSSKLREIANLLDKLPMVESDLSVIKRRLRGLLSTDPDKTPRGISVKDLPAVTVTPETETKFESVEDRERRISSRTQTRPGLGIPIPKPRRD